MSGWEPTDTDRGTWWAVLFGEDYSIVPDAFFPTKEAADGFVSWVLTLPEEHPNWSPHQEVTILETRDLRSQVWNSYDPVPTEGPANDLEAQIRTLLDANRSLTAQRGEALAEVKRLRAERDEVRAAWRKWLTEPTDEESAKGEAVLDRLLGGPA